MSKPTIRIVVTVYNNLIQEVWHEVNEQEVEVVVVDRDVREYGTTAYNLVENLDGLPAVLDLIEGTVDREFVAEAFIAAKAMLK